MVKCGVLLVVVPDHEHVSANVDEGIRQEHVGSDVPAAFLVPLDALESRGKDDCLRTPPLCARVSKQLGSSKVFSGLSVNVDFLVGESDDLLAAEQSMHLEGKTKNNARWCEIATCAVVGAEIQTCIRSWVQAVTACVGKGGGSAGVRSRSDVPNISILCHWQVRHSDKNSPFIDFVPLYNCDSGPLRRPAG